MPLPIWLREYLDQNGVRYSVISHSTAYTAQEIAALTHVPGKELAKTVVVKDADHYAMAVLPAHHRVDVAALSRALGSDVRLASEEELARLFPGCELGAMPPFGNVYRLPVWVAEPLTHDDEIVFNAGTHTEVVRVKYADYARLVTPRVASFSRPEAPRPAA